MVDEDRLSELVLSWQELHEKGHAPTPEELCADCPELLPSLRERIDGVQAMAAFLDSTPGPMTTGLDFA